ncbi:phosphatase PAP2 family protein [Streptomyces sp. TLI_171]|uniref:phosphatase PAP2 family protein n=1 Tax=Streptomyces sp. TLI_171 TaxID=1938859 RepID=UPI000C69802C|nr:undecaprenyl-diphosphatase [Streptomyces sp. TLI_171]
MPADPQSPEQQISTAPCTVSVQSGRESATDATESALPPISRRHALLFGLVGLLYLTVVLAILYDSPLVDLDWALQQLRPYRRWPEALPYLDIWVVAGQRGPTAIAACLWLGWRCYRAHSARPLLVMGMALLLLNVTVGGVKILTGRLGPHYAHYVGSPELFSGGSIFPSGHTANAVVTWGVLAYLATRWRRTGAVLAALTAASIGLTTVYLGTHWISDVFAGWAAGALVLLSLPLAEPAVAALDERVLAVWHREGRSARPAARPRRRPVPAQWPSRPLPALPQPAQARSTVPARTVRLSRSDRYSMVSSASGASSRTVRQPRSAASARASSTGSPR